MYAVFQTGASIILGGVNRFLRALALPLILEVDNNNEDFHINPGHICATQDEVDGLQTRRADIGRLTNED